MTDSNGGDTYAGELLNVSAQITNNGDIAANNVSANLVLSNVFKAYLGETKWQFDEIKPGASVSVSTQLQVTENISKDIVSAIQMAIKADNAELLIQIP
ncbi:MAG: hypothetical protein NTV16_10355 [Actinobacteria bacterium]|nr:hypothetical protein [Actinomycetota bacterium]